MKPNLAARKYRENHREEIRVRQYQWRKTHPQQVAVSRRKNHLSFQFGMTFDDLSTMIGEQMCLCKICKKPMSMIRNRGDSCNIDHDHTKPKGEPGRVRGLLCSNCNRGLGYFQDNPKHLRTAAKYVEQGKQI